jgi:hypothetical protein
MDPPEWEAPVGSVVVKAEDVDGTWGLVADAAELAEDVVEDTMTADEVVVAVATGPLATFPTRAQGVRVSVSPPSEE